MILIDTTKVEFTYEEWGFLLSVPRFGSLFGGLGLRQLVDML
jgi:hypothetical protein